MIKLSSSSIKIGKFKFIDFMFLSMNEDGRNLQAAFEMGLRKKSSLSIFSIFFRLY